MKSVAPTLGIVLAMFVCAARAEGPVTREDDADRLGYSIGFRVGSDFRMAGAALDPESLIAGVRDALAEASPRLSDAEMREALKKLHDTMQREPEPSATPEPGDD